MPDIVPIGGVMPSAAVVPIGGVMPTTNAVPSVAAWTRSHPKTAQVLSGVINTLPAIGAVTGGVLASPFAAASTPIGALGVEAAGVGLGAGAGRGLRDLIAQGLGVESTDSSSAKAGRIVLDTTEAGLAQMVLPGLVEAFKAPGRTIGEAIHVFRKTRIGSLVTDFFPELPEALTKKPAAILVRPAEQMWKPYVDATAPVSPKQLTAGAPQLPAPTVPSGGSAVAAPKGFVVKDPVTGRFKAVYYSSPDVAPPFRAPALTTGTVPPAAVGNVRDVGGIDLGVPVASTLPVRPSGPRDLNQTSLPASWQALQMTPEQTTAVIRARRLNMSPTRYLEMIKAYGGRGRP